MNVPSSRSTRCAAVQPGRSSSFMTAPSGVGASSLPLEEAYLTRRKKRVDSDSQLLYRRHSSMDVQRQPTRLQHTLGHTSSLHRPLPVASSQGTVMTEQSVFFSMTKLGKLLRQEGFQTDRDFEVNSISLNNGFESSNAGPSPRTSPSRRWSCTADLPSPRPSRMVLNQTIQSSNNLGNPKFCPKLGVSQCSEYFTPKTTLESTKIGKLLMQRGLELEKKPSKPPYLSGKSRESRSIVTPRIAPTHSTKPQKFDDPPGLSGSDCSATVSSHHDDSSSSTSLEDGAETGVFEQSDVIDKAKGSVIVAESPPSGPVADAASPTCHVSSSQPEAKADSFKETFVPVSMRVSVEVLKERAKRKAAERKYVIEKIKSMDSRLSVMLMACREANRRIKMVEKDVSISEDSDDMSDLSLIYGSK